MDVEDSMAQTQTQTRPSEAEREEVELSFKRFILTESADFASEPAADLFRVNLLGRMLDRYDERLAQHLDSKHAARLVKHEFSDIAQMMREQEFDLAEKKNSNSAWPQLSEEDAAQFIQESDNAQHKVALGTAMCAACVFPLMIGAGFDNMFNGFQTGEVFSMFGLMGMFAMIALGVYAMVTAKKPKKETLVRKGRFSLSTRVRRKLTELREAVEEKARRRRGKGIALLVGCVVPIFVGAALDSMFRMWSNAPFSIFGVAGMFLMIGTGVYEIVVAEGEKKTMKKLLEPEK